MEITGALGALSSVIGLAKTALDARDHAKAQTAVADAMTRLIDLSMSALTLMDLLASLQRANSELEKELHETKLKTQERERYTLAEAAPGVYAYRSNDAQQDGTPPHYLCQPCYDKGEKVVLRRQDLHMWGWTMVCPTSDKHSFPAADKP
jgi:hypothetical protein